jgi:hypothetical protein
MHQSEENLSKSIDKLSEEIGSFRCRRGFVISNFPESSQEAAAFDSMIREKHENRKDYKIFMLTVPSANDEERLHSTEVLTSRATGMMLHPASGRLYNANVPELAPQSSNIDDVTGEPLVCPKWDLSNLGERLNAWWNIKQQDISNYYQERLERFNALESRDNVSIEICKTLLQSNAMSSDNDKVTNP